MRTIKFRGKRVDNGEWVYGYYVQDPKGNHRIYYQPFAEATSNTYHFVTPSTVGQFTGLQDKNGKDIYEGDLIIGYTSFELSNDEAEWTIENPATVDYDNRSGSFYPFSYNNRWRCDLEDIEIIGNIHDNPELLNQSK